MLLEYLEKSVIYKEEDKNNNPGLTFLHAIENILINSISNY